ncbi:MAG: glycosyltransferase family 4 protein [Mariprofundaceae bacterium]
MSCSAISLPDSLLIIGYVWPEPTSSAAGSRMMILIRLFLAQGWQITFASPATKNEQVQPLNMLDVNQASIAVNDDDFDTFIHHLQPDMVLFDRFMMEEQFGWRVERTCPNALRLLDTVDLHCLRHARQKQYKANAHVVQHIDLEYLFSDMALREIAAIYRSDLTLLISDAEISLLQDTFAVPANLLHLCSLMVESNQTDHILPGFSQRANFITIGNFRHEPNWDAVLWLKQQIWPKIRRKMPQATLHIYGAYPPEKAMALHHANDGFHLLGWAEDANDVLKHARLLLAPLRFGAGLKGKIANAMLAGTPNITTCIGAEGMMGDHAWGGRIANHAEDFANTAVDLYHDKPAWQQAQQHGFEIIRQLDQGKHGDMLIKRIKEVRDQRVEHRLQNFTGAMLRHHQHRSTEFMSRWIMEKNQRTR